MRHRWLFSIALRQRRRQYARGWGNINTSYDDSSSDLEGVSLIRRGAWGEERVPVPPPTEDHRGLLSVAVEFLFGHNAPTGPSEEEKWKLRGAVIVDKSQPIALCELSPYFDSPPFSLDDSARIVSEGLLIVAHFNGKPAGKSSLKDETEDLSKALFGFPELLAESRFATHYTKDIFLEDTSLFYAEETTTRIASPDRYTLPEYLIEQRKGLTKLTSKQFYHCLLVAILNAVGVVWFAQALVPGGILEQSLGHNFVLGLKQILIPVLLFYAKFFFFIPAVRLVYILGWNRFCNERNRRRKEFATLLLLTKNRQQGGAEDAKTET